jgi:hypothetical protein
MEPYDHKKELLEDYHNEDIELCIRLGLRPHSKLPVGMEPRHHRTDVLETLMFVARPMAQAL